jgi:catechol 2,3-dioxygenase-like lactoylglutathione lyase family enzyme
MYFATNFNMNNMKLTGVRLLVKDFDESFKFYSEKLGLRVVWGKLGGEYASFDFGSGNDGFSIFPSDLMAHAIDNVDLPMPTGCREKIAIIVSVDSVDKSYEELLAKGVEFVNKPTDMTGWGMRTVHLRDNEGNLIELYSELPMDKWDKDLLDEMKEYE